MTVVVNMEANSAKLDSALSRLSQRFRGLDKEAQKVSGSAAKVGTIKVQTAPAVAELRKLNTQVTRTTANIEQNFTKVTRAVRRTVLALGALTTGGLITQGFAKISDELVNLDNRIALVTGRNDDLAKTRRALINIAAVSRTSMLTTTETFNRFGLALKDSNTSLEDMLKATSTVQKSLAISGASAESASAAIFQLGQGLASGTLRGQELNSVLEQAPRIARAISDELDVSMGSLRAMAAEGLLTTDVVLKAMVNQASKVGAEFEIMNATIAQSKTVLGDAFKRSVFNFDKGFGFSAGLADNLSRVTEILNGMENKMTAIGFAAKRFIVYPIYDLLSILGGVGNILSAIFSRVMQVGFTMIAPMRTFADDFSVAVNYLMVGATTNLINSLLGLRATMLSFVDAGISRALFDLINANSVMEFRSALDAMADSIRLVGLQWFNVGNKFERFGRQANITLLKTGIYLGLIDQKMLRFRKVSFENVVDGLKTTAFFLKELFTVLIADPANDLWVATAQIIFQKFGRIIEGVANSYRDFIMALTGGRFEGGYEGIIKLSQGIMDLGNSFGSLVAVEMYSSFMRSISSTLGFHTNNILDQINLFKIATQTYNRFFRNMSDLPAEMARNGLRSYNAFSAQMVSNATYLFNNTLRKTYEDFPIKSVADFYEKVTEIAIVKVLSGISAVLSSLGQVTNIQIFKVASTYVGNLASNVDKLRETMGDLSIDSFSELFKVVTTNEGLANYLEKLAKSIKSLTDMSLEESLGKVAQFAKKVNGWFFWLYDEIIGNSWWTDTMEGVSSLAGKHTKKALEYINSFSRTVNSIFKNISDLFEDDSLFSRKTRRESFKLNVKMEIEKLNLGGIFKDIKSQFRSFYMRTDFGFVGNILDAMKDFRGAAGAATASFIGEVMKVTSGLSEDVGRLMGLGLLTGIVAVFAKSKLASIGTVLLFALTSDVLSRAFEQAGQEIYDSAVFAKIAEPIGHHLGKMANELLRNIPMLVSTLSQMGTAFVDSFLANFGVIGRTISYIKSLVPGSGIFDFILLGAGASLVTGKFKAFQSGLSGIISIIMGQGVGTMAGKLPAGGLLSSLVFGAQPRAFLAMGLGAITILGTLTGYFNTLSVLTTTSLGLGLVGLGLFGRGNFLSLLKTTLDRVKRLLISTLATKSTAPGLIETLLPKGKGAELKQKLTQFFTTNFPSMTSFFQADQARKTKMARVWIGGFLDPSNFKTQVSKLKTYLSKIDFSKFVGSPGGAGNASGMASMVLSALSLSTVGQSVKDFFLSVSNQVSTLSGKVKDKAGKFGLFSNLMFGSGMKAAALAAIIIGIFTAAANAATGAESAVSAVSRGLEFGLVGLALFGVFGHRTILKLLKKVAVAALTVTSGLGAGSRSSFGALQRTFDYLKASVLTINNILPVKASAGVAGRIGKYLFGGAGVFLSTIGRAIMGLGKFAIAVGALPFLGMVAGAGFLTLWLFGPGNGIMEKISWAKTQVVNFFTGTTALARKTRSQIEGFLQFDKVGTMDLGLKDALDSVNLNLMSDQQLSNITSAIATANKVFSRNQSIYEREGRLTRAQIREVKIATNLVTNAVKDNTPVPTPKTGDGLLGTSAFNQKVFTRMLASRITSAQSTPDALRKTERDRNFFNSFFGYNLSKPIDELVYSLQKGTNWITPKMSPGVDRKMTEAELIDRRMNRLGAGDSLSPMDFSAAFAASNKELMAFLDRSSKISWDELESQGAADLGMAIQESLLLALGKVSTGQSYAPEMEALSYNLRLAEVVLGQASTATEYEKNLQALLSSLRAAGADIDSMAELRGRPQETIDAVTHSLRLFNISLENAKSQIFNSYNAKQMQQGGEPISRSQFNNNFTDIADAASIEDLTSAVNQSLNAADFSYMTSQFKNLGDVLSATIDGALLETDSGFVQLSRRISDAADGLEIKWLPSAGDFDFAEGELNELEKMIASYSGKEVDFFNIEEQKLEVFNLFADTETKLERVFSMVDDAPSISDAMTLSKESIDRIVEFGSKLAAVLLLIRSGDISSVVLPAERKIGTTAQEQADIAMNGLKNRADGLEQNIKKLLGSIGSDSSSGSSSPAGKSGGGAAKTWWEAFNEGLSTLSVNAPIEVLANLSKSTIGNLTAASADYLKAQEAINKSAADEVELRRKSLKIMQEAELTAMRSLNDGTFGGLKASMEAGGQSLSDDILGRLSKEQAAFAYDAAEQIKILTNQRLTMQVGSIEAISASQAIDTLTLKISDLGKASEQIRDTFASSLTSLLDGSASLGEFFSGLLDMISSKIIEEFSASFTDALFDALGLDQIFNDMFAGISEAGTKAGGGLAMTFGTGVAETASQEVTPALFGGSGAISGIFKSIGKSLTGIFKWIGGLFGGFGGGAAPVAAATGGLIRGAGTGTSDSIAAMLSNGEFVTRASMTKKYQPLLEAINNDNVPAFARGGQVGPVNKKAVFQASGRRGQTSQHFEINVHGDVSRQSRKEIVSMLPEIANGVNMYNKERGNR